MRFHKRILNCKGIEDLYHFLLNEIMKVNTNLNESSSIYFRNLTYRGMKIDNDQQLKNSLIRNSCEPETPFELQLCYEMENETDEMFLRELESQNISSNPADLTRVFLDTNSENKLLNQKRAKMADNNCKVVIQLSESSRLVGDGDHSECADIIYQIEEEFEIEKKTEILFSKIITENSFSFENYVSVFLEHSFYFKSFFNQIVRFFGIVKRNLKCWIVASSGCGVTLFLSGLNYFFSSRRQEKHIVELDEGFRECCQAEEFKLLDLVRLKNGYTIAYISFRNYVHFSNASLESFIMKSLKEKLNLVGDEPSTLEDFLVELNKACAAQSILIIFEDIPNEVQRDFAFIITEINALCICTSKTRSHCIEEQHSSYFILPDMVESLFGFDHSNIKQAINNTCFSQSESEKINEFLSLNFINSRTGMANPYFIIKSLSRCLENTLQAKKIELNFQVLLVDLTVLIKNLKEDKNLALFIERKILKSNLIYLTESKLINKSKSDIINNPKFNRLPQAKKLQETLDYLLTIGIIELGKDKQYKITCKYFENLLSNLIIQFLYDYWSVNEVFAQIVSNTNTYQTITHLSVLFTRFLNQVSFQPDNQAINEFTFQTQIRVFFLKYLSSEFIEKREVQLKLKQEQGQGDCFPDFVITHLKSKTHIILELKIKKELKTTKSVSQKLNDEKKRLADILSYELEDLSKYSAQVNSYYQALKSIDPDFDVIKLLVVRYNHNFVQVTKLA